MSGKDEADIRKLSFAEVEEKIRESGEKPFRAKQVWEWLWNKGSRSFSGMTSLPLEFRKNLSETFAFPATSISEEQVSRDGTVKVAFRLDDGAFVEGVLIPSQNRTTACISSQVGCALGCTFCATGRMGFRRNLTRGEIFDQVILLNELSVKRHGIPLSNIVYMGMGEPLMNYEAVTGSVERLTAPDGQGLSAQRITVSSVGIPKMIRRMADDGARFHFAWSLHAATDAKRSRIIPVNVRFPLAEVSESLKYYHQKTRKRFTIEYILYRNFNDSPADAQELARFCRSFPVKINLIPYNRVGETGLEGSDLKTVNAFAAVLENRNMVVNIRTSKGGDIDAACGQLAGKKVSGEKQL
jgi:23S rRNA (adenine2503-C2)-methyltransferase